MDNRYIVIVDIILVIFYFISTVIYKDKPAEMTFEKIQPSAKLKNYMQLKYGDNFDWTIQGGRKYKADAEIDLSEELIEQYRLAGVDMAPYAGKQLKTYSFELEQSCFRKDGSKQKFALEVFANDNNEFVADYIQIEDTIPGAIKTNSVQNIFDQIDCGK